MRSRWPPSMSSSMSCTDTSTRGSATARGSREMAVRTTTATPGGAVEARRSSGVWRDAFGRLIRNRLAIVGGIFIIFLAFLGIFGPRFAPWPYDAQDTPALIENNFLPLVPFQHPDHLLGTDTLGQDILSRLMDGAQ